MCGIAGIFLQQSTTQAVSVEQLEAMLDTMPHRGPDARGTNLIDARTGLGHLRLAILDLRPESNQPFVLDDGDLTITYNGEIFNYIELRAELETLGAKFRTQSDTEVVLAAYRAWGAGCQSRFNGMWAFAIYDRRRDVLFCSRDRFGIKPFNYAFYRGRFLFASEIKAILAVVPELAQPDYDAISRVLRASIGAQCNATCFHGVNRLPPGHSLTVTRESQRLERYWRYPAEIDRSLNFDAAADRLRELLVDAVRLRMRSDVPVGLTLSGGVDSSALACLLRSFYDGPFDTFTAAYEGEWYDESGQAAELSHALGMTPHQVNAAGGEFLDMLRKIVWHIESPTQCPAVVPLWNIDRLARSKATVLLEGQGADELLAGYSPNFTEAMFDQAYQGRWWSALSELRHAGRSMGKRNALLTAARRMNPPMLHKLYRQYRGDEGVYVGPLVGRDEYPDRDPSKEAVGVLNQSLVSQLDGCLGDLLHYGDAISMAHSIEARVPFLDYRLVEFCLRMPGEYKFRNGIGKAILRHALRQDVPAPILQNRRKLGFVTPIARWFREQPEQTVYPVLRSEAARQRGIFSPRQVDEMLARHVSGKQDVSSQIFRWTVTELWFQTFIDQGIRPLRAA
ncbi:MAG: asparagine synthase (glutamine-hydrolyzing) [Pirellulales bacterium]|nr:asparagine synthase (glutamine-hydrolyzing) [Pirellulales bacterium]